MEINSFQKYVIFEDNHLLIVNKPNNILVQGDKTGDVTLLDKAKAYIKEKYNKPGNVFLGLVHRLDRPTSGVLIFARTSKALTRLNKQLRDQKMAKSYLAISSKKPNQKSGKIDCYLFKNTSKNVVAIVSPNKSGAKSSETNYDLIQSKKSKYLFALKPITGRSHQLRVHLSSIGSPILGDLKYGASYALPDKSIALHCREMSFLHPVSKEQVTFTASLPESEHWKLFSTTS